MISDSEVLVKLCWERQHGNIQFVHNKKNGDGDSHGEDFSNVRLYGYTFSEAIQVKTSDNGTTLGIVIPINDPKISKNISSIMWWRIKEHLRKHPNVRCMLFVAKTGRHASEEKILRDIWKETKSIFYQLVLKHHKKQRKVVPLAFNKGLCYNHR